MLGCASENNPAADLSTEISAEIYDPTSQRWTPTGNMAFIQHHPTATLLPVGPVSVCGPNCGKVLVVGTPATIAGKTSPADAEIYDPRSGTWTPTASTEHTRDEPASVVLHTGRVLVTGTVSDLAPGTIVGAELFDPATATWATTGNAEPYPNAGETVTVLADGRALAVVSEPTGVRKGQELYDPTGLPDPANPAVKGGAWTLSAALADQRNGETATVLHDGTVLVTGGNAAPPLATAELYNDKTATWTSAATMAGGRGADQFNCECRAFTATLLNDGTVLIVGASYRTASLFTYFEANTHFRPISPAAYGPSAELYTPATASTGHKPLIVGLSLAAAVALVAIGAIVVIRRKKRHAT